eukprot:SAG11_NODE_21523_length_423_cov_2.237654_1_plen_37_part_01
MVKISESLLVKYSKVVNSEHIYIIDIICDEYFIGHSK